MALFAPPSPSPPSFMKNRESTHTYGLRAVTQTGRNDTLFLPAGELDANELRLLNAVHGHAPPLAIAGESAE